SGQRFAKNGTRSRDGANGSGETGRVGSGNKNGGQHSVHAAGEKGSRARRKGSQGAESFLRWDRTHFAGIAARRRGRSGTGVEKPRDQYRAEPSRNFEGT